MYPQDGHNDGLPNSRGESSRRPSGEMPHSAIPPGWGEHRYPSGASGYPPLQPSGSSSHSWLRPESRPQFSAPPPAARTPMWTATPPIRTIRQLESINSIGGSNSANGIHSTTIGVGRRTSLVNGTNSANGVDGFGPAGRATHTNYASSVNYADSSNGDGGVNNTTSGSANGTNSTCILTEAAYIASGVWGPLHPVTPRTPRNSPATSIDLGHQDDDEDSGYESGA